MSSTNTNKQPVFTDRPLYDTVRLTTEIAGSASTNTLFVQGGQQPAILVDMDALLTDSNNSGGVIDSVTIVRNDAYRSYDYEVTTTNSGNYINLVSGQILSCPATAAFAAAPESGIGYYTYTGSVNINAQGGTVKVSGLASANTSGFAFLGQVYPNQPEVTVTVYQTRGTTTPIPASGDYRFVFTKSVPSNTQKVDCSDVMPILDVPVPQAGNTTGLDNATPLRNKGIYLERGDRLYVGIFPDGPNSAGYSAGASVIAQGGYF